MTAPIRHNETSHSTLLCRRWQPGRGTHAVPALAVGVDPRLRHPRARVKRRSRACETRERGYGCSI